MLLPPLDDYDAFVASYEPDVRETFNYVDIIDSHAEDRERLALVWADARGEKRELTFKDIAEASAQLANALAARGVGKGDRVLVMFDRRPEWAIAGLAVLRLGAVLSSCVTMLQPKDLKYRIDAAGPKAIVADATQAEKFAGIADAVDVKIAHGDNAPGWERWETAAEAQPSAFDNAQLHWDEPASLYFTSGSTGLPKGVLHGAHFALYMKEMAAYWLDLNEQQTDDLFWCTADTGWALAATGWLVGPWLAGVTVFAYDGPFDPAERLALMERHGVTVFCAPATELRWIVQQDFSRADLSKLRLTVSTGEMLDAPTAARWREKSEAALHEAFGQTESFMTIANMAGQAIKPGSMGKTIPGFSIEILDQETFQVARPDVVGHIAIRQPTRAVMLGYWNDEEKTASVYEDAPDGRFYLTGDLARRDADGYYYYEGRADDVINSSGYRIGPGEVEAALLDHPAVKDCAAVGSPDPERGEIVKAFIILNDDWRARDSADLVAELQAHAKEATAPYKYPRRIAFVDDLPRTATGKVRRKTLRDQEYAAAGSTS